MGYSETIDRINKAYVSGCAGFYSKFNPDPWRDAHDELDRVGSRATTQDEIESAAKAFECRIMELIENYKRAKAPKEKLTFADAFMLGSPDGYGKACSVEDDACYRCGEKVGLAMIEDDEDDTKVFLSCKQCTPVKQRGRVAV